MGKNEMFKCGVLLAIVYSCVVLAAAERGFILKGPRVLAKNGVNKFQLTLYDVAESGEVTLKLLRKNNDTVYSEKTEQIPEGSPESIIDFYAPEIDDYEARLQVSGKFNTADNYGIFGEDDVTFMITKSKYIFIQTDKPLYKPEQQVKFRVLCVDGELKPLKDIEGLVWIEDPDRVVVGQWKNVSFGNGLKQFEIPLSNEPKLGLWNIYASINGTEEATSFEVKEYVLPKFEITIKSPSFVLADAESIPIEICAKYTYGKLVEGKLKTNISVETYHWSYDKVPHLVEEHVLNGCYNYVLNLTLIDGEFRYHYRRLEVFAEVTEKGTGVVRNETKYIDRTQAALHMVFESESGEYFKPGLPYHGKVKVTKPDSSPESNEPVRVCMTVSRERVIDNWWATKKVQHCRNFTSDENGIIHFTIPPQNTDTVTLNIEAKSIKVRGEPKPPKPTLYIGQANTHIRPWYSPSGSYMQIQDVKETALCNKRKSFQVLFTSRTSGNYKFFYEVVNKGRTVSKGSMDVPFDEKKDDVSKDWQHNLLDEEEIQISPVIDPENRPSADDGNCKIIDDTKYIPFVGSVNISLDVTAEYSPSAHILIYYIRQDRETVADSKKFTVEKCFAHEVNLEFDEESKQPGTKTTLTLSASPNSLCGIKVVDKSVSLLDSSEKLTKDKVFDEMNRYDFGHYYSKSHCNGKKQPGLEKQVSSLSYIPPPRPPGWTSSSYEDALTAFENSGLLVISDFVLLTRPCKNSGRHPVAHAHSGYGGGGAGNAAFSTVASRRPVGPPPAAPAPSSIAYDAETAERKEVVYSTKSVVDVRSYFPETWLFEIERIGEDGKLVTKKTLPHTITEWLGSAVCINEEDGLGMSDVTKIKGFQHFFMSTTLPYSVIRGEKLPIIVTVFNYLDKCLPISLEFIQSGGFILLSESEKTKLCVCGGKSETFRFYIQPTTLDTLNLTISGKTAESSEICGSLEVAESVARDAITNPLIVEAEGFPYEKTTSSMFCPKDYEDRTFRQKFTYNLPEDLVEGSARGYYSVSGDIMGPTIQGLDRLVQLPTGCGEQNIVKFTPNVYVLDYLTAIGELSDKIKQKAIGNLQSGYQQQLKSRRNDFSYSAFGNTDSEGSLFLTALVFRSFAQASNYIPIDSTSQDKSLAWIVSKQREDGCFAEVGRILSQSLKGGIGSETSRTPLTAFVIVQLLSSGMESKDVVEQALTCIQADDKLTPYKSALFAYTFALAGQNDKAEAYLKELYLTADTTAGDKTFWHNKHASVQVEIAAYAVLTNLKLGKPLRESLPIIKWMNENRNSRGGFISTQDTVLGLEALKNIALLLSAEPVDIEVKATGGLEKTVSVTNDDKLLLKKYKLPSVPSDVNVEGSGTGCALVQATVKCNTKTAHKKEYFSLEVESSRISEEGCKFATINVCTSYLVKEKKSNMALVELKMVSGFVPLKESLQKLQSNKEVQLKRFEVDNNNVVFYFDELTAANKCFSFVVEQIVEVDEVKPATAKVYDYYATEYAQETSYTIADCQ